MISVTLLREYKNYEITGLTKNYFRSRIKLFESGSIFAEKTVIRNESVNG